MGELTASTRRVADLLSARPAAGSRGMLLFAFALAAICIAVALRAPLSAVVSGVGATGAAFASLQLRKKAARAREIAAAPQSVASVHATVLRQQLPLLALEYLFLTIHLRSGETFEVAMRPEAFREAAALLLKANPEIHISGAEEMRMH